MRKYAARAVLVMAAGLMLASCMSADEQSAFDLMNRDRAANGRGAYAVNEQLVSKAQQWADHLLQNSGGRCSSTTLVHTNLTDGAPAGWRSLGENVGCGVVSGDPKNAISLIENTFMNSSGHRANILSTTFNQSGIGLASMSLGNNMYLVFETQEFVAL